MSLPPQFHLKETLLMFAQCSGSLHSLAAKDFSMVVCTGSQVKGEDVWLRIQASNV
jgi:hypothetical protein